MRIAHVYDGHEKVHGGRGSVPDVVWQLAHRTAATGHAATVIERQWAGLPKERVHDAVTFRRLNLATGSDEPWEDIPYRMISRPTGALRLLVDRANFARRARQVIKDIDPDVLHVHLPFAANILATAAPGLRNRLVYTAHLGETEKRVRNPRFSPDVYLANRTARTVVLNPTMKQAFVDRGVPSETLAVIPNGVDPTQFDGVSAEDRARVSTEYGVPSDAVLVLYVGTVTPRKGVRDLVRAVSMMDNATAHVAIVGRTDLDEEYVSDVERTIDEEGLDGRVTLTGFVSEADLHAMYDLADVFTLPSYEEGSSISVMEAIAAGLPVVGSRIDGISQQIEDGVHGSLVDPGDIAALSSSLDRLVSDDSLRAEMAAAMDGRARELSWDRVIDTTIDLYREVTAP